MMFWVLAVIIGVLAAAYMGWPLLRERAALRNYGLAIIVLVPLAALGLYQQVGTPAGIGVSGSPGQTVQASSHPGEVSMEMDQMVGNLERRLQDNPADAEGWMLLGRTYKTTQQYDRAETALLRAYQLLPNDPVVLVELAEAKLFASRNPVFSSEVREMLERVLVLDPNQQKGLWLLGIAAAQEGNDALAVELWERLSAQLPPDSPTLASVREQITQARERSGLSDAPQRPVAEFRGPDDELADTPLPTSAWRGLQVRVAAPEGLGELPGNAALFVIVRNPAMPNPPLGVARLMRPAFPAVAIVNDANSMMENMPISAVGEVELTARLSMSGNPVAQPGDLQSETVQVNLAETGKVELTLN
jgi:cytochrome c-type biogenesis protein CcmH